MPKDCSTTDLQYMISIPKESNESNYRSFNVLNVRSVPGSYSLWADGKFRLLL